MRVGDRPSRAPDEGFLSSNLWIVPVASLLGASLLAILTTSLDRRLLQASVLEELFLRNPEAVRTALSVVASSILTFTALVFTITMVVVQQASNQLSPRVVRTFLEDRMSQLTLGVFMGTFAYSLLVLRDVRSPADGPGFVPGLSVALVFVAVFVSLALFVAYLSHITDSLQMSTVVRRIADETRSAIELIYPPGPEEPIDLPAEEGGGERLPYEARAGVLRRVDRRTLAGLAEDADCTIRLLYSIGDFVPEGSDLLEIRGSGRPDRRSVLSAITIGARRNVDHDVAFGFRQLVDIAERALSPGVNDPTTAVQVIDQLHDLLRGLSRRDLESAVAVRRDGQLRVIVPGPMWGDFVRLSSEELRHYGSDSIQVTRRLRAMLDDLARVVPDGRAKAVQRERELLDAAAGDRAWRD